MEEVVIQCAWRAIRWLWAQRRGESCDSAIREAIMLKQRTIAALIFVVSLDGSGTTYSLQAAEWTLDIAPSVPVIQHPVVPPEERDRTIQLQRDLTIGQRGNDPQYILYDATYATIDDAGRIFVADRGNDRVQVFDDSGEYVMTIGREGRGPGEFDNINSLTLVGNRLIVGDSGNGRYSVFSTTGELLESIPRERVSGAPSGLFGLTSGTIAARLSSRQSAATLRAGVDPRARQYRLALLSGDLEEIAELAMFPLYYEPMARQDAGRSMSMVRVDVPHAAPPLVAAVANGPIYATVPAEYQVYAFGTGGEMVWALRVPWPRVRITEDEVSRAMAAIRREPNWSGFTRAGYEWPSARPAVERIAVDGSGNVHVVLFPEDDEQEDRMVDVYSPDGGRIFAGWTENIEWFSARNGYVLAREVDDSSGDERIVRYRLALPFE